MNLWAAPPTAPNVVGFATFATLVLTLVTASFAADSATADQPAVAKPEATKPAAKPADQAAKPPPAIALPEKYPVADTPISITLNGVAAGASYLRFTYQPDSRVETKQTVQVTGNQASWTPQRHGIVKIQAVKGAADKGQVLATTEVSVKFASTPLSGVFMFLFAGVVLFGGVWFSMRLIFAGAE